MSNNDSFCPQRRNSIYGNIFTIITESMVEKGEPVAAQMENRKLFLLLAWLCHGGQVQGDGKYGSTTASSHHRATYSYNDCSVYE